MNEQTVNVLVSTHQLIVTNTVKPAEAHMDALLPYCHPKSRRRQREAGARESAAHKKLNVCCSSGGSEAKCF